MGPAPVVIQPPGLDDLAGVGEAEEPVLVEALIAEPAIAAFEDGVLGGLAGGDRSPGIRAQKSSTMFSVRKRWPVAR